MRYLHQSADELCKHVQLLGMSVMKSHYLDRSPGSVADTGDIAEMLKQSETLWGTALPYYFHVSKFADTEALPLKEAVAKIEASHTDDEFLVVAYQDGGIISISGVVLPFQIHARAAEWWAPYRSARRS